MPQRKCVCIKEKSGSVCKRAEKKLRKFLLAQMSEIDKFKWDLGVQLCRDPLEDRTLNQICLEWIDKHAAEFREAWEKEHGKVEDGDDNSED